VLKLVNSIDNDVEYPISAAAAIYWFQKQKQAKLIISLESVCSFDLLNLLIFYT